MGWDGFAIFEEQIGGHAVLPEWMIRKN